ncbi:MAG: repressor LexA [Proteobacteria bacterium]|uniref:transcriptional repressor LexA n=1 Tax=Rudaea sp. TaxID=2136325 RepID=UPI003782F458|nr:repressor LexA [Pseudomonadota bacterium]
MKQLPSHGGARPGAGRKPGSNRYGEPTTPVRVPQSRLAAVRFYLDECAAGKRMRLSAAANDAFAPPFLNLPLIGRVAAGQPIGADAQVEREIAIDRHLFRPRPDFLLRVEGMSMRDAGILDRDLIAVHRTPEARNGQIVIARIDGEITVKEFRRTRSRITLLPANPDFAPIEVDPQADDFAIEGLYVGVIRLP